MSFFNDFFKEFDVSSVKDLVEIFFILGKGIVVLGDVKIDEMSGELMILKSKKRLIKIIGERLYISSVASGEFVIKGNVKNVDSEDLWWIKLRLELMV